MRGSLASLALLVLALSECAPRRYAYAPATTATTSAEVGASTTSGSIATYAVPSDDPRGEVRVSALGLDDRRLHVRLAVTNRSEETWSVKEGQQEIELDARYGRIEEPATPLAGKTAQVIEIAPGGTASIDLYFVLPAEFDDASKVPAFDVIWTVDAGTRPIMQRTVFQRQPR